MKQAAILSYFARQTGSVARHFRELQPAGPAANTSPYSCIENFD